MTESSKAYEAQTIWEAPDGSQWRLVFWLKKIAGRPECVGLEVTSYEDYDHPERPLRGETLRALRFSSELHRAWESEHARFERLRNRFVRTVGTFSDSSAYADERAVMAGGKARRRKRYTTKDLQRVVAWYQGRLSDMSASPTRDTAEHFGLRYDQAAKLIQRCRGLGLLPKTGRGLARGSVEEDE